MKSILTVVLVLAAAAAAQTEKATKLTCVEQEIEAGKAREVTVELVMARGQLEISGGADALFELDSYETDSSSAPELWYEERGAVEDEDAGADSETPDSGDEMDEDAALEGHIEVNQPDPGETGWWAPRWDVRLDDVLCRELEAAVGDGFVKLTLDGTALEDVELDVALGDATMDLRGLGPAEFEGRCETGLGDVVVFVPAGAGVRVEAETEMGKVTIPEGWSADAECWTSPGWGKGGRVIELELSAGMGDIMVIEKAEQGE